MHNQLGVVQKLRTHNEVGGRSSVKCGPKSKNKWHKDKNRQLFIFFKDY